MMTMMSRHECLMMMIAEIVHRIATQGRRRDIGGWAMHVGHPVDGIHVAPVVGVHGHR